MEQSEQRSLYKFRNTFFSAINISRSPSVPKEVQLPVEINFGMPSTKYPTVQVDCILKSGQNDILTFEFKAIGLFEFMGPPESFNPNQNIRFINQFGIQIIWPYITQMVRIITSQMGTNPININLPDDFPPLPENIPELSEKTARE